MRARPRETAPYDEMKMERPQAVARCAEESFAKKHDEIAKQSRRKHSAARTSSVAGNERAFLQVGAAFAFFRRDAGERALDSFRISALRAFRFWACGRSGRAMRNKNR
jgi:hypothetical protein